MVSDVGTKSQGVTAVARVAPPVIDVRVPGVDVVVKMGGEPWRLVSARRDPPLALLVRMPSSPALPSGRSPLSASTLNESTGGTPSQPGSHKANGRSTTSWESEHSPPPVRE